MEEETYSTRWRKKNMVWVKTRTLTYIMYRMYHRQSSHQRNVNSGSHAGIKTWSPAGVFDPSNVPPRLPTWTSHALYTPTLDEHLQKWCSRVNSVKVRREGPLSRLPYLTHWEGDWAMDNSISDSLSWKTFIVLLSVHQKSNRNSLLSNR